MNPVPEAYYQFIMDYAPFAYVVPPDTPDAEFGRTVFAAAFAIDFLVEACSSSYFDDRREEIANKIAFLADFIVSQQCTNPAKLAYGGFKSSENSTYYYAVDACRVAPSLLKAYDLTTNVDYLNAVKLAATVFLYDMQHKPSQLGIHDKYYGGFARAVTEADGWLQQMDVECLYGLIGLMKLCEHDSTNKSQYETMMADLSGFLRAGLEQFYLYFDPPPNGNADWHRIGTEEAQVLDDCFAYALLGMYEREGWSQMVQRVYSFLNNVRACAQYPAYNPAVCWAGYIDVVSRFPTCDYYDAVTSGILWKLRRNHDKPSCQLSMQIVSQHQEQFMFWGVKHVDFSSLENRKAMATVCWLSQLFLNYEKPRTRFTQILEAKGENLTLASVRETGEKTDYGESMEVLAIVCPSRAEEILIEPGYVVNDFLTIYTFTPMRNHDKIRRKGEEYEVQTVQPFTFSGETAYFKAVCRRLIGQ